MNMFTIQIKIGPDRLNPQREKETLSVFMPPVPYVDRICRQLSFVNQNCNIILSMFTVKTLRAVYMNGDRILSKPDLVESYPEAIAEIDPAELELAKRAWVCHGAFKD